MGGAGQKRQAVTNWREMRGTKDENKRELHVGMRTNQATGGNEKRAKQKITYN